MVASARNYAYISLTSTKKKTHAHTLMDNFYIILVIKREGLRKLTTKLHNNVETNIEVVGKQMQHYSIHEPSTIRPGIGLELCSRVTRSVISSQ